MKKYLIMLILPVTLIFTIGCEDDEVDKCNDLTETANEAQEAWTAATDSTAFCCSVCRRDSCFSAGLDAGCDQFSQDDVDTWEYYCN
jgi:hypothetical protein